MRWEFCVGVQDIVTNFGDGVIGAWICVYWKFGLGAGS